MDSNTITTHVYLHVYYIHTDICQKANLISLSLFLALLYCKSIYNLTHTHLRADKHSVHKHPLALLKALHQEFPQCCCHLCHPSTDGRRQWDSECIICNNFFLIQSVMGKEGKGRGIGGGGGRAGDEKVFGSGDSRSLGGLLTAAGPEASWESHSRVSAESTNNRHEWR